MGMMRPRYQAMPPGSEPAAPASDKDFEAQSKKVEEAKAPIAAILNRRNEVSAQDNDRSSMEQLLAEYVKNRYDLVVDNSFQGMNDKVLYRSNGEVPDITEGVVTFFKEKTKN